MTQLQLHTTHLFFVAVVMSSALWGGDAEAQAWIREPGSGFVDLSYRTISGDAFYDANGDRQELASTYRQTTLNLYGEVGVVERWLQVTVSGEVARRNELEDQGATSGVGDFRVGVWSGLLQDGPLKLSGGLILGVPLGDPEPDAGSDPDAQLIARSLPTGDGEFDLEPNLTAGTSFGGGSWPLQHYLVASAGYQIRTEGISDAVTYRLELGSKLPVGVLERVWLIGRLSGLESLAEDGESGFAGMGDGVTFMGLGADVAVSLWEGIGVSAGFETAVRAENIVRGVPLRVGVNATW